MATTKTTARETRETTHTPGPWHVTAGPQPREIRADDGPFIASVYDHTFTYGERNANARLLAAAPELLAALKAFVTFAESVALKYEADSEEDAVVLMMTRDAHALIAKAEGRAS